MQCENCGAELPAAVIFCPNCGARVENPVGAPLRLAGRRPGPPTWLKLLVALVSFAVFALGTGYLITRGLMPPIERQLEAFRRGDADAAYAEMSRNFQAAMPLAEFRKFVSEHDELTRIESRFLPRRFYRFDRGDVGGTLTLIGGQTIAVEYHLIDEAGAWKIDGFSLDRR